MRNQIFNLISKGFYLFHIYLYDPKWGDHSVDVAEGGAFWRSLEPPWPILELLSPGVLVGSSPFGMSGPPLG